MKTLMTACLLFSWSISFAQSQLPFKMHTFKQVKREHSSDKTKNSTLIYISGVLEDEIYNVKMIVREDGIDELNINEEDIPKNRISEHKELTRYILEYAELPTGIAGVPTKVIEEEEVVANEFQAKVNHKIRYELIQDGYMEEETDVYDFVLSAKAMYFNGKKQDEETFMRYKKLYEEFTGKTIGPTSYFHMSGHL